MQAIPDPEPMRITTFLGGSKLVLGLAIGVAVVFIGLLMFDQYNRRRRGRRSGAPKEGFRTAWRRWFQSARALRQELKAFYRERARRKERAADKRPGAKR
jgi:hypothetical protein